MNEPAVWPPAMPETRCPSGHESVVVVSPETASPPKLTLAALFKSPDTRTSIPLAVVTWALSCMVLTTTADRLAELTRFTN